MFRCWVLLACVACASSDANKGGGEIPEEVKKLIDESMKLAQDGQISEAIEKCIQALKIKDHYTPHHMLSQLYLANGDHDKSLEEMEKAYNMEPSSPTLEATLDFHKAVVEQRNGNYVEAMKLLRASEEHMLVHEVKHLEKLAIAALSMGDITYASKILKELWRTAPAYEFHNKLPMVRVVERYEKLVKEAQKEGGDDGVRALNKELNNVTEVTETIWMDLTIEGKDAGRVVVGLYGIAAPKATRNMVKMVQCETKKHCFKGAGFHRIVPGFILQGGDVEQGDGTGVRNIYDRPMADEVFGLVLMHDRPGVFAMANAGPNSNGGQFVIMCNNAPHLNGGHLIVGVVLEGMETVMRANSVQVDKGHKPSVEVIIKDCGNGKGPASS